MFNVQCSLIIFMTKNSFFTFKTLRASGLALLLASTAALTLTACGGGSDGAAGPSGTNGLTTLAAVVQEAIGSNCPTGGSMISAGLDVNGNGILDAVEVKSKQYVCNGTTGLTGGAGKSSLVKMTPELSGANCVNGGTKITAGLDANGNNVLDASEVSATDYVCSGNTGAQGLQGPAGGNGRNSLIAIVAEGAGANCTYGGSKVSSGLDSNSNSILDAGEVTATSYNCNGAPGPGITWVNVSGTSVQAESNKGYLAYNAAQVVVTLPASPAIGDLVQISGVGTGGWKLAQNAGQSIIFQGLPNDSPRIPGVTWTARDSGRYWSAVASSADGRMLVAVVYGGYIYTSTDSGVTWTQRDSSRYWQAVASSADGSKLVATDDGNGSGGYIYTSTDSGATWTARDSSRLWSAVASSADGSKLVAADISGFIYTSTDSGVTWTARESSRFWRSVTSSADGSKLVAVAQSAQIYTSTDSGVSWTARDSGRSWSAVASSADGSKLVAVASGGQIYTSTDSGVTWTARDSSRNWKAVASSADGSKLVAAVYLGGQIYTSSDSGVNWTARDSSRNWKAVASSADGSKLVAAVYYDGQIYTSVPADRTTLGTGGWLLGSQHDTLTLQYIGGGLFTPLSYVNYSGVFNVN
jgi:photosystem II stability/assembly factor-like uncharacterized protein